MNLSCLVPQHGKAYIDDGHPHQRQQPFALIIVLLGDMHSALAVLGYVFLIASLHHC